MKAMRFMVELIDARSVISSVIFLASGLEQPSSRDLVRELCLPSSLYCFCRHGNIKVNTGFMPATHIRLFVL